MKLTILLALVAFAAVTVHAQDDAVPDAEELVANAEVPAEVANPAENNAQVEGWRYHCKLVRRSRRIPLTYYTTHCNKKRVNRRVRLNYWTNACKIQTRMSRRKAYYWTKHCGFSTRTRRVPYTTRHCSRVRRYRRVRYFTYHITHVKASGFRCNTRVNWVSGMRYSQIVIRQRSLTTATNYCKKRCTGSCTGFFYQKHRNGHQICGFYRSVVRGRQQRHGHAEGAVCIKARGEEEEDIQSEEVENADAPKNLVDSNEEESLAALKAAEQETAPAQDEELVEDDADEPEQDVETEAQVGWFRRRVVRRITRYRNVPYYQTVCRSVRRSRVVRYRVRVCHRVRRHRFVNHKYRVRVCRRVRRSRTVTRPFTVRVCRRVRRRRYITRAYHARSCRRVATRFGSGRGVTGESAYRHWRGMHGQARTKATCARMGACKAVSCSKRNLNQCWYYWGSYAGCRGRAYGGRCTHGGKLIVGGTRHNFNNYVTWMK